MIKNIAKKIVLMGVMCFFTNEGITSDITGGNRAEHNQRNYDKAREFFHTQLEESEKKNASLERERKSLENELNDLKSKQPGTFKHRLKTTATLLGGVVVGAVGMFCGVVVLANSRMYIPFPGIKYLPYGPVNAKYIPAVGVLAYLTYSSSEKLKNVMLASHE